MPTLASQRSFDGAEERIYRLGMEPLWRELVSIVTGFELRVEERRDANGGAAIRALLDARFAAAEGWTNRQSGAVDWTKCRSLNGSRVCLGVEVQLSVRSDLLIVDVQHLRDAITAGAIDVGVIVVASDRLAVFLTAIATRSSPSSGRGRRTSHF